MDLSKEQLNLIAQDTRLFFDPLKLVPARVLGKLELVEWWQQIQPYRSLVVDIRINEIYAEIDELKNMRLDVIALIQAYAKREQYKKILMNRFIELMSIEAIAEQMNLAYRDVQRRLQRALRAFKLGVLAKYNYS